MDWVLLVVALGVGGISTEQIRMADETACNTARLALQAQVTADTAKGGAAFVVRGYCVPRHEALAHAG